MKPLIPIMQLKRKPRTMTQLFSSPRRWTKRALYRDGEGYSVPLTAEAHCVCLLGAADVLAEINDVSPRFCCATLEKALGRKLNAYEQSVSVFNDDRSTTFSKIRKIAAEYDRLMAERAKESK